MQRGKSDQEVLSEVAEALLPYLIDEVDIEKEEEEGDKTKTLAEIEVNYKGLRCSALRLGYGQENGEKRSTFLQRVVDVCDILGHLRHPNLLQFLGVSFDLRASYQSLPLIVSELSPISLSSCIDRYGVLPNELSYSIVRDVALGLRYLHEQHPSFIHGDLSTKSVLLAGDFTAKISRVGVSHLLAHKKSIPSQQFHLPPEVTDHGKRFDKKVDIFSLGIILLHTFTGRSPIPKTATPTPERDEGKEEGSPSPPPFKVPSQADMRLDYINDLGMNHPIMDTILHCIRNQPMLRPDILEVSSILCKLAASHHNLFGHGSAHRDILYSLEKERKKKFCKFYTQISTSDSAYGSVTEAELEELQIRCRRLSVQNETLRRISLTPDHLFLSNRFGAHEALLPEPLTPNNVEFNWERCAELPVGVFRAQATLVCGRVYVGGGLTEHEASDFYVFEYNLNEDTWGLMPPLPVKQFGLGKLAQDLVVVGGQVNHERLSEKTFVFDQYNQLWKESIAMLNTPRFSFTMVESEHSLTVMGGLGRDGEGDIKMLSSIEVLDVDMTMWTVIGNLPNLASVCSPSLAEDGNMLYLVGGYRKQTAMSATSHVYASSLSPLTSTSAIATKSWKALPSTPHLQTTAVCLNKCLMVIGGSDKPYSKTIHDSIHAFNEESQKWQFVDQLPYHCCHSTAIAVTNDEVLVLGGWVKPGEKKASRIVYRGRLPHSRVHHKEYEDMGDYITLPAITITS